MQHGVAAIRAARSRTRFVLPSAGSRMERQLGLHRVFRTPSPRSLADVSEARRQPLKALRQAARSIGPMAEQARASSQTRMPEPTLIRWTRSRGAAGRGTAPSGSSPWRG
jgi:hypothetical protein